MSSMSDGGSESILELDALLDPARLAAAWQQAVERAPVTATAVVPPAPGAIAVGADGAGTGDPDDAAGAAQAASAAARPALPVALAHRQLLEELERTKRLLAASPKVAAERVLSAPLAQLAAVVGATGAPLDLAAAEAVLDELEDVLQALLSAARWPASGEE
jgi:hypothetical protein